MNPDSLLRRVWSNGVFRYLFVGGACFLADLGLLWIMHALLGVPLVIATPVAFLLSFAITYFSQRYFAFQSESTLAPSVARYTTLVAFNTVATTGIVWAADELGWSWIVGKVISVGATTVWNFFAYRYWVFAAKNDGEVHV